MPQSPAKQSQTRQSQTKQPQSEQSPAISELLQNNGIWQAAGKRSSRSAMATGYCELDKHLHYGGWPQGALSEILLTQDGIGEIRLLAPLLSKLNQQPGYITWINPPYQPYAPALVKQHIDLNRIIIVRTRQLDDTVWAAQQALASKACSAVLTWLPSKTLGKEIRKLNLAAKSGHCWGFIFRSHKLRQQASAAPLRLVMETGKQGQKISIIKQPGGWSGQQLHLDLFPERVQWSPLSVEYWPKLTLQTNSCKTLSILEGQLGDSGREVEQSREIISQPAYH